MSARIITRIFALPPKLTSPSPRTYIGFAQATRTSISIHRTFTSTAIVAMDPHEAKGEPGKDPEPEWKQRAPYKIHESNEDFNARYEASCHCGKVKYQLSREEPLDSKLCHCTTCQTQHGEFSMFFLSLMDRFLISYSRTVSVGSHLPQGRHQLLARPPRPRMV